MYQALYRKWRPKIFDDVVGQEHVTKTLKNEIESGKISHAYLFIGSRGTGKTSCAKIFAKAVNCLSPADGNPCGKCEMCTEIQNENALDIIEIDAASNNGVENIRSMREEIVFSPAKCKYRVYIVDEVHMLSAGAFNAFLKILEEPPEHIIFILATTELHKIPATIISRCQRFNFKRISKTDLVKRLEFVCKEENIKIEPESTELIAKYADGGMRDALSILDQCANSCQNNVTFENAKKTLGVSSDRQVEKFAENILDKNSLGCLEIIDEIHRESVNIFKFCENIMEYFANIMVDVVNKSRKDVPLEYVLEILDTLQISYQNISSGSNAKLEMETVSVKLCENIGTLVTHEGAAQQEKTTLKENTPLSFEKTQNLPVQKTETKAEDGAFEPWHKILEELKNTKTLKSLYISLRNSNAYKNGNYILIDSKNSLAFELLRNNDEYRIAIKNLIKNITGHHYSLGPYKPENKEKEQTAKTNTNQDPLDALIKKAEKSGIDVILN